MIKIMIVDDMPIFLEYLRGFIEWDLYGFEICCEAADGREALGLIPIHMPDIILADITMPHVDGLELAGQVSRQYPGISVVLITGNNELEYAKKAVQLGVCDYILKPFEKEELLFSLLKLQDNLYKAAENKSQRRESVSENRKAALRKLISEPYGAPGYGEAVKTLAENGVVFEYKYFMVCTMRFLKNKNMSGHTEDWEEVIIDMLSGKMKLMRGGVFQVFSDEEGNVVVILNFESESEMKSYHMYELTDISKVIKEQLGLDTIIGISDYGYGPASVGEAYRQAVESRMHSHGMDAGKVTEMAEEYIRRHYMDAGLSVAEIARELSINQTYLRRMFKSEKNQTLSEYITAYRMETAMELVRNTDDKLAVIAEKSGYSDVSYFSKCFKRFYGESPKMLRENI